MTDENPIKSAIEAIDYTDRSADRIIEIIREQVANSDGAVAELLPGYRLVKNAMPVEERVRIASRAAARSQRAKADERYAPIIPIIKRMIEEDPTVSLAQIKEKLDQSGHKPQRSSKWSRQAINYIIKREKLRDADGE